MTTNIVDEPDYVMVARSLDEDAERIELPTNEDNTLGLQTLNGAFPGAHGLKYKNPTSGAFRAVLIDPNGTKFHPPPGGWAKKVFLVLSQQPMEIVSPKNQIRKSGDQNAKRRKLMVEESDADSCGDSDSELATIGDGNCHSGGGKQYFASSKRQQTAFKQKRMMGVKEEAAPQTEVLVAPPPLEQQKHQDDSPNRIVDLLVMGLPFELTEDDLRVHFEKFGKVVHCEIKTQRGTSTNRGFGFVQMADLDTQRKVLKQKIHSIGGRECQVKIPFSKNALSSKVFVGRIKESTTVQELRKVFAEEARKIDPDSSVTDVYIPRPFRSFAFVTLSSPVVAKELIRLGQLYLHDSPIYISSAHSTRPQEHGSGLAPPFTHQPPPPFLPQRNANEPPIFPSENYSIPTDNELYNEWYGLARPDFEHSYSFPVSGMHSQGQNRPAAFPVPVYHQQPRRANSHLAAAAVTSMRGGSGGTPAAAGNQMLNQLETLNLNNMGINMAQPQDVVSAIKAIFTAATVGGGTAATSRAHAQQPQQHISYTSLSPPGPSTGANLSRGSGIPINYHQQQYPTSQHFQARRNGGASGQGSWRRNE